MSSEQTLNYGRVLFGDVQTVTSIKSNKYINNYVTSTVKCFINIVIYIF